MSDESGKYPFDGAPNLSSEFNDVKNESTPINIEEKDTHYDAPAPTPKPSWVTIQNTYAHTEFQMPHIIDKPRTTETTQENQNYDAIKDNNNHAGMGLKGEWEDKVWEAPTPEIGDD
tara:strand:- start:101 stop:451 length:351 start_codon:yes stop_codon:yes gene_type:complete